MCTIFRLDILGKISFHLRKNKNYGNDNHNDVMYVKDQLNNNAQTKAATAIKFYKQQQPAQVNLNAATKAKTMGYEQQLHHQITEMSKNGTRGESPRHRERNQHQKCKNEKKKRWRQKEKRWKNGTSNGNSKKLVCRYYAYIHKLHGQHLQAL